MKCSKSKIKAMKSKTKKDVIEYKKQLNLVVKLKKRSKKEVFDNLETKITLNRFGQLLSHISPINRQNSDGDILLIENDKILLDNRKTENVFNEIIV